MQEVGLNLFQLYPNAGQIFAMVFVLSIILTAVLYFLARQYQLLPQIRARDLHATRKPRVGGVAMWLALVIGLLWVATDPSTNTLLSFFKQPVSGLDVGLWGILLGLLVILIFGFLDDLLNLRWYWQLLGQFLAALSLVLAGVGVTYIRLPFNAQLPLDIFPLQLPDFLGGQPIFLLSALFTIIWIMTMINVMNFFDGLDGLAGSVAMTAAAVLFFVSLKVGFIPPATLSLIICAVAGGFLVWNWYPSKIFMGTVGSQMLGFLLGVTAIISGGKVATAVLVLGIPLLDALIVMIRRLAAGVSPLQADQRHLHHRLLKIGLPTPWVVILVNLVAVTFGIFAVRSQATNEKGLLTLFLIICMAIFIAITYLLERHLEERLPKRVD